MSCKFLQSLKLGTESYENVPKDRLITIVSRLYNETNKPFRYTIIQRMLLVNLHTQAWRCIPQSLLKRLVMNKRRPICVISCARNAQGRSQGGILWFLWLMLLLNQVPSLMFSASYYLKTAKLWWPWKLRACLQGDGGLQEGEVTPLAVVQK